MKASTKHPPDMKVYALQRGTVIDHIRQGKALKVLQLLGFEKDAVVAIGLNFESEKMGRKDIVKFDGRFLDEKQVQRIALVAPEATVVRVDDFKVVDKYSVKVPDRIEGILKCANPLCISRNEQVTPILYRVENGSMRFRCHYCERVMDDTDLRDNFL